MTDSHDRKRRAVGEPVQVYLNASDRLRLQRLTQQLDATKSDVLRRALEALERLVMDPASHPSLRIIGLAGGQSRSASPGYDVAREHDRFLAETEVASWKGTPKGNSKVRGGRKRG